MAHAMLSSHRMRENRRLIIVRRGDEELFQRLKAQYAGDSDTEILYDRRVGQRRTSRRATTSERRRTERRFPYNVSIVVTRGYFVTRDRRRRALAR
jgi:hypothetical protein